jgi:hypothetical protein
MRAVAAAADGGGAPVMAISTARLALPYALRSLSLAIGIRSGLLLVLTHMQCPTGLQSTRFIAGCSTGRHCTPLLPGGGADRAGQPATQDHSLMQHYIANRKYRATVRH